MKRIQKDEAHKKQGIFHPSQASSNPLSADMLLDLRGATIPILSLDACKQKRPEADAIFKVLHKYNITQFIKSWFGKGLH